jgi:hypothetical protein
MVDRRKEPSSSESAPRGARFPWAAVVLAAVVGLVLRAIAARGDLWLDEIWTLDLVRKIQSPLDVLTRLKHDNNHPLNSLLCWLLLESRHDIVFRLPSVVAGGVAVMAAARVAWRLAAEQHRRLAAVMAAGCFAVSFLMVNYGSEARGYGLALAFSLVAWMCVLEGHASRRWLWTFAYWLATSAAYLAHASSIYLVLGLVGQAAAAVAVSRESRRTAVLDLVTWHAVPLVAFAVYYLAYLSSIRIGGGTPTAAAPILAQTVSALVGVPDRAGAVLDVAVLVVLLGWVLLREAKVSAGRFVLFATAMIASPLLVHSLSANRLLYPRYFLVPCAVLLIGVAIHAASFWGSVMGRRAILGLAMLLFVGNTVHLVELARFGRGSYREAIAWMAERSPFKDVVVASDNDFRNGTVLMHHAKRMGLDQRVQFIRSESAPVVRPEWIILHRFHPVEEPAQSFPVAEGINYGESASFRGGWLSGCAWYVYRYAGAPAQLNVPPKR